MKIDFGSDEELDRLLDEQFIKEAEILEQALLSNRDVDNDQEAEEEVRGSYDQLVQRLKAEGIYREDEEAEETGGEEFGTETPGGEAQKEPDREEKAADKVISASERFAGDKRRRKLPAEGHRRRAGRAAGFLLACALGVFAVSMTSEGNRRYFVNNVMYWMNDNATVLMDNDESNEPPDSDEYDAALEIEDKLHVDVPELWYRPSGFQFKDYKINEISGIAWIEYYYGNGENIVTLYISQIGNNTVSNADSTHGTAFEMLPVDGEDTKVYIEKIDDIGQENANYYVKWERKDAIYQVVGRIEREELIKIIENLVF